VDCLGVGDAEPIRDLRGADQIIHVDLPPH
jgi:hypothetical protein